MKNILYILLIALAACQQKPLPALVFQTDFGVKDGAVSAMKGVATGVDARLKLYDLTHEIPAYNIWEAAYRLEQTAPYWPAGTVFVSVVDPGVGTHRKSVVMHSRSGHYFVTPDNGTLTLVARSLGIDAIREIDESINRRQNSGQSYTFHGRDVYAYTGARLAAGIISFEQVGPLLPDSVVSIPYQPALLQGDSISGNIPILDIQYGNIWTNIPDSLFKKLNIGSGQLLQVKISHNNTPVYAGQVPYAHTFGEIAEGKPLGYMNSLMNFSLALNMGSFADSFHISSGPEWTISISKFAN
ncbi:MAG: S-adenosyl-l-methionine hydroxide adenosyltransferase family protein [Chitinophagaceae bacterium]